MNQARSIWGVTVVAGLLLLLCGVVVHGQITASSSNNAFGLDLYRRLAGDPSNAERNLWFSPYSLTSALAMATDGARGNTLTQMGKTLRFSDSAQAISLGPIHEGMAALNFQLDTATAGPNPAAAFRGAPSYQMTVANALWGDRQYPFEAKYVDTVHKYYGAAGIFPVDFLHDAESARVKINAWTEEQTRRKIKDLLGPGMVDSSTRMVLTNAVYFKGSWVTPFEARNTTSQPFHTTPAKQVSAPLMRGGVSLAYMENEQLQLISLPYVGPTGGQGISMVIVLPKQAGGLGLIEQSMTASQLGDWIGTARYRPVEVFLPKFKMTAQFELKRILGFMGMTDAFSSTRADFSGISSRAAADHLHISAVIHKAYVDVDENGTEAAAATAIPLAGGGPPQGPPPVFRADHPFLFMIRHDRSGTILFMGRVVDPTMQ